MLTAMRFLKCDAFEFRRWNTEYGVCHSLLSGHIKNEHLAYHLDVAEEVYGSTQLITIEHNSYWTGNMNK